MTNQENTRKIVVGLDHEASELVLNQAFELASSEPSVELHVIHVLAPTEMRFQEYSPALTSETAAKIQHRVEAKLREFLAGRPELNPPARIVSHVRIADPAYEVAQLAADLEADLVIVGTHGRRAVARLLMGSVAESVVRLAPCPVLVVRRKAEALPVPRIEPPCPRCVEARRSSAGAEYWCEQHRERHGQRHTYHQGDRVSADSTFPLVFRP